MNPFLQGIVSTEDAAAFSDELTKNMTEKEAHYQKGYSSDNPEVVEENKIQQATDQAVDATIDQTEKLLAGETSTESDNPFVNTVYTAVEKAETEGEQDESENPFLATTDEATTTDVTGEDKIDVESASESVVAASAVSSLGDMIKDLEEAMADTQTNARSTEFVVDVVLDDPSKEALDSDLEQIIETNPEGLTSLESIKLCDERSIPTIINILKDKITDLTQ